MITRRPAELATVHARHLGGGPVAATRSDEEVLAAAFAARNGSKVSRLYSGDDEMHEGDTSRADLALVSALTFYTLDRAQLDRIFRGSPRFRAKWDEVHYADGRTYGEGTIETALGSVSATHSSANETKNPKKSPPYGSSFGSFVSIAVPGFPTAVLPPPVSTFVSSAAVAHGVPDEYVALPFLTDAGAAIGRTACIELKRDFREYPILWTCVVGPPGSGKTPAARTAHGPLHQIQDEAKRRFDEELAVYEEDLAAWQGQKDGDRGTRPRRPVLHSWFTTDATTEALAEILQHSPGVVLQRDEIVGWVKGFDAYRGGKGGDRQNALSAWSASTIKVDRKTKDPILISAPVAPVAGGVQPEMLSELADEAGRRDGFIERILWGFPETAAVEWTDAEVATATRQAVESIFHALRAPREDGDWPLRVVRLSGEARQRFVRWFNVNARQTRQGAGVLAGVDAKLPSQVARLALILWCLQRPEYPGQERVDVATVEAAITLGEYFRDHARKTLAWIGVAEGSREEILAHRIERTLRDEPGWISRTTLHGRLGGHVRSEELDRALALLKTHEIAEPKRQEPDEPGRPGRRAELWRLRVPADETKESLLPCAWCGAVPSDGGLDPDGEPWCQRCREEEWGNESGATRGEEGVEEFDL